MRVARHTLWPVLLAFAASMGGPAGATVLTVHPDGSGPYPTIQSAWDAAVSGVDSIELADGTFAGPGNRNLSLAGKMLTLRSASGDADLCSIDCASGPIGAASGAAPRFEAIQFLNGTGLDAETSSIVFDRCRFEGGGPVAIAIDTATFDFESCLFAHTTARLLTDFEGQITVRNSTFIETTGGIANSVAIGFEGCEFRGNTAPPGTALIVAYLLFWPQATVVTRCTFFDNLSTCIHGSDEGLLITDSIFSRNVGPVVSWTRALPEPSIPLEIANCTFADNISGPLVRLHKKYPGSPIAPQIHHSIFAFTKGPIAPFECIGLEDGDGPVLQCSCVSLNEGGDFVGCIAGQLGVDGNILDNPRFCPMDPDRYGLQEISPCLPNQTCDLMGAHTDICLGVDVEGEIVPGTGLRSYPNPFRESIWFELPGVAPVAVDILDSAGRIVSTLHATALPNRLGWDGRDAAGRTAPAGVYYAKVRGTAGTRSAAIVRLR